jgi:2-dehydro-3-deoxy-D-arabinonate dehydratase
MKLYNTTRGILVTDNQGQQCATLDSSAWDVIIAAPDLFDRAQKALAGPCVTPPAANEIVAPIGTQEVWAAGVTYYRSRSARIEESKDAGGGTFYDRVYSAERPELFFKATARRVIGPGGNIRIRTDATWSVPEPELTLVINPNAEIVGYTIGNDMSSRDIEGENPLYLPQAKVYDGSCALGPCVLLADTPLPKSTAISISIKREGSVVFTGSTSIAEIKREFNELVSYLFRDNTFPTGACLMTGTGVVPEDDFTLAHGDVVTIVIDGIGTLSNTVA